MKGAGMIVVSLRGVHFGFWSHLGCSGQNAIIFSRKGLFQGCTPRNIKNINIFNSFYLLDLLNQSLKWSLLGVKNRLLPRPDWSSLEVLIQHFRRASPPLSYPSSPPPLLSGARKHALSVVEINKCRVSQSTVSSCRIPIPLARGAPPREQKTRHALFLLFSQVPSFPFFPFFLCFFLFLLQMLWP